MQTSDELRAQIIARLGFVPTFFEPAFDTPDVFENLWQQTLSAYLENPLPDLFKEKLSAYLSRYCEVPYCLVCHSCTLAGMKVDGVEVLRLLDLPIPDDAAMDAAVVLLNARPSREDRWDDLDDIEEQSVFALADSVYQQGPKAYVARQELRRFFGRATYNRLVTLILWVKTCHLWMEANPVPFEHDERVTRYFAALVNAAPRLSSMFVHHDRRSALPGPLSHPAILGS